VETGRGLVPAEEGIEEQAEEAVEEGQEHDPALSKAPDAPPDRRPVGLSAPHTRAPFGTLTLSDGP
jgi:hypothetical protein